jgi:predicted transcriptional regulator
MVVKLKPETESRLQQLAATIGREPAELVEDAMAGYLAENSPKYEPRWIAVTTKSNPAS